MSEYRARVDLDLPVELDGVLGVLVPSLVEAMSGLVSIVLWGSAVLGDWRPGRSDVDLLALLDRDPDEATLGTLRAVSDVVLETMPGWRDRLEIACIGEASLRSFRSKPHVIVRISPGETANLRTADAEWLIDWFQARAHGVALVGRAPADVLPEISVEELREEALRQLRSVEAIPDELSSERLAYVVLRVCRARYTSVSGRQASKAGAGRWVAEHVPAFERLVLAAIRVHAGDADTDPELTVERTRAFLAWGAAR